MCDSDSKAAVKALIGPYWEKEERARWFKSRNLPQIGGLPYLNDEWTCPLRPTDHLKIRTMRDVYNEEKPMTLVLPHLWIGSRRAGHDNEMCLANGISHVLCVAATHECRQSGGWGRQVVQMGLFDANRIVEPPPLRKHDRIDLRFYQDSSREEYSFSNYARGLYRLFPALG